MVSNFKTRIVFPTKFATRLEARKRVVSRFRVVDNDVRVPYHWEHRFRRTVIQICNCDLPPRRRVVPLTRCRTLLVHGSRITLGRYSGSTRTGYGDEDHSGTLFTNQRRADLRISYQNVVVRVTVGSLLYVRTE